METFDDLKLERYINKALLEKSFGRTERKLHPMCMRKYRI